MSLQPQDAITVPEATARVARAAFPKGNPYLTIQDVLGPLFNDTQFAALFPRRGQPAQAPWRLALVTILQFAEDLSDRQAAEAVRARIDWKYVLALELEDPGFDASVLCEFRARLVEGAAESLLFDTLLQRLRARGLVKAGGKQRTDSTHVLAAVRAINRIELVLETMRHALDTLAVAAPEWLLSQVRPEWIPRYERRGEDWRLPQSKAQRTALARAVGVDGRALLTALFAPEAPAWLRALPAVQALRHIWMQNYQLTEQETHWREAEDIPPSAQFLSSPHDLQAHLGKKGSTCWVGYKVHLTETCEEELPNLITQVDTTSAPVADGAVTPQVHQALKDKDLLPVTHIVDTGYLDAQLMVSSQKQFGVDLLGPTRADYKWQAREGNGFDVAHFALDWEKQEATCPEGHPSHSWTPSTDNRNNAVIRIKFSPGDCGSCPSRCHCVRSSKPYTRRSITVRPQEEHAALQAGRAREKTEAFKKEYARRAGVEGTLSRGVRTCGLRQSRYVGEIKVHLGHLLTATALNFLRASEWFAGIKKAKTRRSPFTRLMTGAAPA